WRSRTGWRTGTCCRNWLGCAERPFRRLRLRVMGQAASGRPLRPMTAPLATHDYTPGGLEAALEFLKRTRAELRTLRKVRLWKDRLHVIDVNKDYFEIRGIGYADADVVALL